MDDVAEAEATLAEQSALIDELRERVTFLEQLATGSDGAEVAVLTTLREVNRTLKARGNEVGRASAGDRTREQGTAHPPE